METTKLISDALAITVIALMAVTIACPLVALLAQDAGDQLGRLRNGLVRRILRRLSHRLDATARHATARHGTAFRAERDTRAAADRRSGAPDRRRAHVRIHPQPGPAARLLTARAPNRDRREQKRFKTCFLGTLHRASGAEPENLCDILDISAGGARVRPVDPMPARRQITLGLRHFGHFPARIVWRRGNELGLKFEQNPTEIMSVMHGLLPRDAFPRTSAA